MKQIITHAYYDLNNDDFVLMANFSDKAPGTIGAVVSLFLENTVEKEKLRVKMFGYRAEHHLLAASKFAEKNNYVLLIEPEDLRDATKDGLLYSKTFTAITKSRVLTGKD